jgi:hypothetical protein
MVVWEKVWENFKEVQWDEVDCPSAKNRAVSPFYIVKGARG